MTEDIRDGGEPARPTSAGRLRQEMAVFNARRQLALLLAPGFLADDIRRKLKDALDGGSRVGPEIAAQLHLLRDMQLGREEAGAIIRAAANRAVERYVAARERGGKLSKEQLDNIDLPDVPAKSFAREFAVALSNQVKWKKESSRRRGANRFSSGGHQP